MNFIGGGLWKIYFCVAQRSVRGTDRKGGTSMFLKKYGDMIVGIFYAALGIALIIGAGKLPKSNVMELV